MIVKNDPVYKKNEILLQKESKPIILENFILRRDFKTLARAAFLASGHVLHAKEDSNNGFLALETRLVLNHFDGA